MASRLRHGYACVATFEPAGTTVSNALVWKDCGCASGSPCDTAGACMGDPFCTTGTGTPSNACVDCVASLEGTEACFTTYITDCSANTACNKLRTDTTAQRMNLPP
jgi:hypothetical protein